MSLLGTVEGAAEVAETAASPFKLWLIAGALVVTVTTVGLWIHARDTAHYNAGFAADRALWDAEKVVQQKVALQAQADAAAKTARRIAAQEKAQDENDKALAAARADAAIADAAAGKLRDRLTAFVASARRSAGATDPSAPRISKTADPIGLLADLFRRSDQRAGELSAELDASRAAGNECAAAYDALTTPPTPKE